MKTATPIEAIVVKRGYEIDGVSGVIVDCSDFDSFKILPAALSFQDKVLGKTGWNSDKCEAYYQSNALIAFPTR